MGFSDFARSGNQAVDPDVYEIENAAIDREGVLWRALHAAAPWDDRVLVDLGCGSGFWLPWYEKAADIIGVEPDTTLLEAARSRPGRATVLHGSAEHLPMPDVSVDVVHARFAYFFPGAHFDPTAGLHEVARVLRPGGTVVIVDNDTQRGEFAGLLRASAWASTQGRDTFARSWWAEQGATTREVMSSWQFDTRADYESVLRLEFPDVVVDPWLGAHPRRTHLSYGFLLHIWTKP